ncbi:MAG: ATP synthase F0 subunit B [Oscillospiraceae bacterium]|nr:ATP synthase F0 subunit B [Oscillospiraceae bacterium]
MYIIFHSVAQSAPPFALDSQTVIQAVAGLISVAVLAAALAFLLYKPVRNMLHKRTEKIHSQLTLAEQEMARAMELRQKYEQKLGNVDREREDILTEARKQAAESGKRLIGEAKTEAEAIKDRAAKSIEMEWERANVEMRSTIIEVSSVMAEKLVTVSVADDTHDKLFDEAISDLEAMKWRD